MILGTAKVCTKCKVEKPFTEFTRRKKMHKGVETWGYKSQCKPCHTEAGRVARQADLDKARAREKELRGQRKLNMTPEQKEELRLKFVAWNTAWRKANPDRVKAAKLRRRDKELVYKRNRYQLKIDELRAKCREYSQLHREEISERQRRNHQKPEVRKRLRAYQQARRPQDRITARTKIRNLDTNYIKLIIRKNLGLPARMQSKSLIETQRLIIQIKREVRK